MSSVMSSFIRLPGLFIRDWKSVLDLLVFLDTIAEMTLKVDQGHWWCHSSYRFLLVVCSTHVSILYRFWDIQRQIMPCPWNL